MGQDGGGEGEDVSCGDIVKGIVSWVSQKVGQNVSMGVIVELLSVSSFKSDSSAPSGNLTN